MQDRFTICQADTAVYEGVNSNHKSDPGGKTRFGITEAVNREYEKQTGAKAIPIFQIPYSRALAIYRRNYWSPLVDRYNLVPGVDRAAYDAGVNSGVSRAKGWLIASAGSNDHSVTAARICEKRLRFVMALRTWSVFGKGWSRRIADVKAKSVRDALEFMNSESHALPIDVSAKMDKSATEAEAKAAAAGKKQAGATAGGSAGAAGGVVADPSSLDTWVLVAGLGAVVALFVAAVIFSKLKEARRAEAQAFTENKKG